MSYDYDDDGALEEESNCCCCHCGGGQEDAKSKSYMKMRDHLQQRLKAKSSGLASGSSACDSSTTGSRSSSSKSNVDDYAELDYLVSYIEGSKNNGKAVIQSNPKKAAKKARQKAKKLEQAKADELAAAKKAAEKPTLLAQDRVPNGMVRITHNPLTNSAVITPLYGPLEPNPSYLQQPLGIAGSSQPVKMTASPAPSRPVIAAGVGPYKAGQTSAQPPPSNTLGATTTSSSQPQQMVTIRRVMQPNISEPVVTVTLKGDTPDYDRVLFTLVNGQVLPTGNSKPTSGDTGVTSTPPSQARFQQQAPTSVPAAVPPPLSRKKQKKQEKKKQKKLLKAANEAVQSASAQLPSTHSEPACAPVATTFPGAAPHPTDFTLDNFRLPPGITLTRVQQGSLPQSTHPELPVRMVDRSGGTIDKQRDSMSSTSSTSPSGPNPIIVTNPPKNKESMGSLGGLAAPNVIVVDTRKIQPQPQQQQQLPQRPVKMCSVAVQTGWDGEDDTTTVDHSQLSKKQRKKLRHKERQQQEQQQQQQAQRVLEVQMAALQLQGNKKVNGNASSTKKANPSSSSASKTPNGSNSNKAAAPPSLPPLAQKTDGITNGNKPNNAKKKKKKSSANKQGQGQGGGGGEDKWDENVFVPKSDLDLEGGDLDDDERELEAFKRFCFNTVPPERKEKVRIHLNVKDIFGKKTSNGLQPHQSCKST